MADTVYTQIFTDNKLKEAERKQQVELNAQLREQKRQQEEIENMSVWERIGVTIADFFTEIGGGVVKLFEGVVDAGAMIAGGIGSIFGADTKWAEDFVARDLTQEWWYSWEDDFTKGSYLNDAPIVKDIARGIGQMLPTIALAPIGLGWVGIGGTIVSAGGTGAEEALNEGADFGEAFAYGTMQGGIEGVIEGVTAGLGKGITSIGKGVGKSVAKSTGKVMIEEAGSEFVEEGLSALLNPLTKTVYKGSEALETYKDMTFYLDAAQQAFVGGVVGGIAGGSSSAIYTYRAGGKTNASIQQSISELRTLDTKETNLWKNNRLNSDTQTQIQTQRQAELENISNQLKAMSESERTQIIERYQLSDMLDADGNIISQQITQDSENITDGEQILSQEQNVSRKPLISDNIEAYSPSLRNTKLIFAPTQNVLSQSAQNAKKFVTSLNSQSKLVFTDNMPSNVNAFYDTQSKVLYFSNNATDIDVAAHEFTHSLEGTAEYETLKNYVLDNVENLDAKIAEKIEQYKNVNTEAKAGENGQFVARYEAETEIVAEEMGKYLSDPKSVERIVNQSKGRAYRIWQWIKDAVAKLTKRGEKGEYYRFIRNVENLYTKAIQSSVGGIGLTDVRAAIDEFERQAKQELANEGENSYNNQKGGVRNGEVAEARYSINERNDLDNLQGQRRESEISAIREFSTNSEKAELETREARREYLDILRKNELTKVSIDHFGVNNFVSFIEINENALLPFLKDLRAENEKLGFKTKFTISGFNVNGNNIYYDNASGLYSGRYDTIYLRIHENENVTIVNNHERIHNAKSRYPELFNNFKNEVKQLFGNKYEQAVEQVAEDWEVTDFSIKEEEFLAEFFAGSERVDFGADIDAQRDAIVEKYRVLLANEGGLQNLRYSLKTDSEGRELSEKQKAFFKDSKALDKNGNLAVVYHGSKADVTEFAQEFISDWNALGDGYYFTNDKTRASRYAKQKLVEAYLDIKNPLYSNNQDQLDLLYKKLNLTRKKIMDYAINQGLYGSDLFILSYYADDFNLNLSTAIQELGFDGIISENFEDVEYVVYSSNQIKETNNVNPTLNADIRYSLNKDSEIKSLVAVHNTTEAKLLQSIELGGLPMPSIAIVRGDMGHEGFGNISLILKADAIDPQKNYDNKVYSADAYSPRFPQIAYSLNGKELRALADKMDTSVSMLEANDFAEGKSRERIIDNLKDNDNFIKMYLKEFDIKEEEVYKPASYSNIIYGYADTANFLKKDYSFKDLMNSEKVQQELKDAVEKAKSTLTHDFRKNMLQNSLDKLMASLDDARNDTFIYNILEQEYNNDKLIAKGEAQDVVDTYETRRKTTEKLKNDKSFNQYVENTVDKVLDKKYLRNNKDYYTNSGNPRSFESLHDDYTAENAVRLMKELGGKNSEGGNVFGYGVGEIRAALSEIYNSIAEMHQNEGRLRSVNDDSTSLYEECNNDLHELGNQISKKVKIGNFLEAHDIALNAIFDIISKTKTTEQAKRLIKRDYTFEITDSEISAIRELADKVKQLPVKYFEAKPERVVNFEEIAKVFVPENTNQKILDFFKDKGIDVQVYGENTPTRTELVKTLPDDIRFSLKDDEGDYNYSKGQISKYVAEHSKAKAYSKTDAEQIVNTIVANQLSFGNKYGEISNKTKSQVIDTLWHALNTKNEGYRGTVALEIADYIIDNAIAQDIYAVETEDTFVVDALKGYLHSMDLSGIKGEIKHRYDNDNSPYLIWGRRKGTRGQSPDQVAMELAEYGIHIEATNEADIFFEIDEMYRNAIKNLKKATKERLADVADKNELKDLRQSIAREILNGYDTTGHKTKFAETIEKYTSKISALKNAVKEIKANNKAKNNVIYTIERLRDEFVKSKPAGWKIPQQVVDFVKKIAKVETWRNNISKTARQHLAELQSQIDLIMDETQQNIYPYRETLRELASGEGELTTQELTTLDNVLRQFAWQLRNYDNVVFEGKSVSNTEIATQGVHESRQAQKILRSGNNLLVKFKNRVFANPFDRMAEFGLYINNSVMVRLYNDMLNGDRRRANFVRDANNLFDDFLNKNKHYLKELQKEITIHNGSEEIKITKRQAITLYLTSLREQGRSHLFNISEDSGVVRLLDNKASTRGDVLEAFSKGRDINITRATIREIKSLLTATDNEYIDIVDNFFNKMSKDAKRETDTQLYGITNIEDGYYFPIKVSKDKIYTEAGQRNLDINQYILDMGMNKSVKPNASNKIVIDGVDNIISKHINDMSLYYGFAIPLTAYNRIMNKQILVGDVDTTSNIRSEIQKIDSDFEGYMNRLWQDIQGIQRGERGFISNVLSKIRWAGANAALGANPKVLFTQTLSLASAIAEFNPKYVVKGLGHFFGEKNKLDLAKYSSLMWERMQIGNSVDVTEIRQIGKEIGNKFGSAVAKVTKGLNAFTTKPISWMDSNVIQSLWFAAQYEIADTRGKGYEFGTEANKIEAGKRLDEAVFHTQQTSDPIGRSEWMRSQNEIVKFARMFTSDAVQLTGKLIASVNKYRIAKKMIKSGDAQLVEQGQQMLNSSKLGIAKAGSAFVLNQVFLLAIALAFKWIKGKNDDEEWDDIAKNEAIANLVGLIPFGGDIFDKLSGYEPTNMAYTALSNTVEIAEDLYNGISTLITGDYQDPVKRNAAIRKTALSLSRLLGIPTQNLESYLKGIIGKISPATREEYEALYKTKSIASYLDKMRKATENGDEQLADTIVNILFDDRTGKIKDDKMLDVVSDLLGQGYDVLPRTVNSTITFDGTEYTLTSRQHSKFMDIYSQSNDVVKNMISLSAFNRLDDAAKAKAINFVYDYYYNLGIEDMLGEDIETKTMLFAEAIPIAQLAMAVAQASIYTADTDRDGKVISGTKKAKVQSFVQGLRLSAVQKYMIMGYLGYSNKFGETSVKTYINRLNISKEAKDYLFEASGYVA